MSTSPLQSTPSSTFAPEAEAAPPAEAIAQQEFVTAVADKKYPVIEVFGPTIQGEGEMIGVQTLFLRMGGCDYRCKKCDSLHAVLPELIHKHATMMDQHNIFRSLMDLAAPSRTRWITFSGGNPAIWDLEEVAGRLKANGYMIAVETQGTMWRPWLAYVDCLTVSPKGPGMGERFEPHVYSAFIKEALDRGVPKIAIKVVVMDARDIEFALDVYKITDELDATQNGRLSFTSSEFSYWLSLGNDKPPSATEAVEPQTEQEFKLDLLQSYRMLTEEILQDPRLRSFRITPQLHVLLWGNERGR